ncbi:hypothetical protein [Pseudobutyrivibrio sp. MD2005]|uniref:hypothetical protein n=1 Tax=Pseudobutyrivibrio sp. MD2005 TaxID=1410616 RepID=UPI000AE68B31|nr:hypothetical protein [Pseudobutyrivibrio sp. MD2005]
MRKYKFKLVENYIALFRKINEGVFAELSSKASDISKASEYLQTAQQKAIDLGTYIEQEEGMGHKTVSVLEEFCEILYEINEEVLSEQGLSANSAKLRLDTIVNKIERSSKEDIAIQRLAVFLPYKSSMWDSLESVWQAAAADENCTALVIPIPYFDKNPDGSVKAEYWEGDDFPEYVHITSYETFDFGAEHPDMIFIHNPYDDSNLVTSVHPFFYSKELKKYTDCLVYIPYYATAGNMSEGQALLPSYLNADYIVIQSEKFRGFFDPIVPQEKFLPLGSPKFDSAIKKCMNPPEPPEAWKQKMAGKKVYFYNTSLNGMLDDTEAFMRKMVYVFDIFRNRKDVCLLWRPHPLFEKTLQSMRAQYLPIYEDIRDKYIREDWGIYDTTPNIEDTIALCDVYIGDAATSVTSLFGVAGKPLFILNNRINELPNKEDWKYHVGAQAIQLIDGTWHKDYTLRGNRIYKRNQQEDKMRFLMSIPVPSGGGYYNMVFDYKNKLYLFPGNAQDIMVVEGKKIRTIAIDKKIERAGAFFYTSIVGHMAFIWPQRYPDLVIFNMETEEVFYLQDISDFNVATMPDLERVPAVKFYYKGKFFILSRDGRKMISVDIVTLDVQAFDTGLEGLYIGAANRRIDDENIWFIPYAGTEVVRFNMSTREKKKYDISVEGLVGLDRRLKVKSNHRLFSNAVVMDDRVIFSPNWGNKFVELNPVTGEAKEWVSPFEITQKDFNCYVANVGIGNFVKDALEDKYKYYYSPKRQWYHIDIQSKDIEPFAYGEFIREEIFDENEGYYSPSEWMKYCCFEGLYNSLEDLIDNNIHGAKHDKELQIRAFSDINASATGDCGEKVYEYLK